MAGFPNQGVIRLVFDRVLPKDIIKDTSGMLFYIGMINTKVHLQEGRAVIHRINPQNGGKDFRECLKKGWEVEADAPGYKTPEGIAKRRYIPDINAI
jgi:hypothetical protein